MTAFIYRIVNKYQWTLPVLSGILTLIALFLTLMPAGDLGHNKLFQYDKLGHMLIFGSWTFALGLMRINNKQRSIALYPIFLAGCAFGLSIEILQGILPIHRDPDYLDFIADVVGCLVAVGVLKMLVRSWKKERILY